MVATLSLCLSCLLCRQEHQTDGRRRRRNLHLGFLREIFDSPRRTTSRRKDIVPSRTPGARNTSVAPLVYTWAGEGLFFSSATRSADYRPCLILPLVLVFLFILQGRCQFARKSTSRRGRESRECQSQRRALLAESARCCCCCFFFALSVCRRRRRANVSIKPCVCVVVFRRSNGYLDFSRADARALALFLAPSVVKIRGRRRARAPVATESVKGIFRVVMGAPFFSDSASTTRVFVVWKSVFCLMLRLGVVYILAAAARARACRRQVGV